METSTYASMRPEKINNTVQLQENLVTKIKKLTDCCGWQYKQYFPLATLLKLISNYSCENRIMQALVNKRIDEQPRFDSYYRQKSEFATIKILDRVKTSLSESGIDATVQTEVHADIGRYDAVVTLGNSIKALRDNSRKVRIEIKASAGLDFEQLSRYLWDTSPLILVRVIMGHVAKLSATDLQPYVTFTLEELTAKVDRLISQKTYTVPGIDCSECLDNKCIYNRGKRLNERKKNVITLPDTEFADDLSSFFKNLSYVSERTAIMVVEELRFPSTIDLEHLPIQLEKGRR